MLSLHIWLTWRSGCSPQLRRSPSFMDPFDGTWMLFHVVLVVVIIVVIVIVIVHPQIGRLATNGEVGIVGAAGLVSGATLGIHLPLASCAAVIDWLPFYRMHRWQLLVCRCRVGEVDLFMKKTSVFHRTFHPPRYLFHPSLLTALFPSSSSPILKRSHLPSLPAPITSIVPSSIQPINPFCGLTPNEPRAGRYPKLPVP